MAVPLTGQMLVSIHGHGLAPAVASTEGYPRPRMLAGVSVTFNGLAAPLLYVSPEQINAQVPGAISDVAAVEVVVRTPAGDSAPFSVPAVRTPVPGIFTQDGSGCGQGFIYNVHADGSTSLNTPSNSLDPQKDWGLTILATGLGRRDTRTDGQAWTFDGSTDQSRFYYTFVGIPGIQNTDYFEPVYSGPMPGSEGVDQINLPLPTRADRFPRGCRVPMWVTFTQRRSSRYVSVSVQDGGGACADPAPSSVGDIELESTTIVEADGTRRSTANIDARFLRGANLRLPLGGQAGFSFTTLNYDPPFCAAVFPDTLSAGQLMFSGAGDPSLLPESKDGILTYHADLDPGATFEGQVNITASGGQVGRFTATADIPPPIQITTPLPAGTSLASPFTLRWTGGDARSIVGWSAACISRATTR